MADKISTNQMVQQIQQKQAQKTKGAEVNPLLSVSDRSNKSGLQTLTLSKRETPMSALYDRLSDGTYIARYDNYLGAEGNEDRLAREQGTGSKWFNGLVKSGFKTINYAADSLIGTIYGAAEAVGSGDITKLYDNELTDFFDDANKKLDNNLKNYYTDDEKAMGLLESMGTANFWANDVTGALAFVGGAVLSNTAMGFLTGGASLGTSAAKMSMQLGKTFAKEGAEAAGKKLVKNLTIAKNAKSLGDKVGTGAFLFRTANFEAGMEARQNLKESVDNYYETFQQKNGRMPSYEESTKFLQDASKGANGVYAANLAILSLSNAVMFGKKIMPSALTDKITGLGDRVIGMGVKKEVVDGVVQTTLRNATPTKVQKILGNTLKIAKKPLTEGLYEEGFQGVAGKTMQNYLDAKYSDENLNGLSAMGSMYDAFAEQYGTKEGWKEMGIGIIIGLGGGAIQPGVPLKDSFDGFFNQSYSADRQRLAISLERANKGLATLAGLNRSSAAAGIASRVQSEEKGAYSTVQDTAENFNYIRSQEHIKDDSEIIEDYNTTIDNLDFDKNPEMKGLFQDSGLTADQYKDILKNNFKNSLDDYTFAKKAVAALDLPLNMQDNQGNIIEVAESHMFNIMAGKSALRNAEEIGKQLDSLIGTEGIFDYYQHYDNLSTDGKIKYDSLLEKKAEVKKLQDEVVKITQKLNGIQVKGVRATRQDTLENKRTTLSEQAVVAQERILTLNSEIEDITKALELRADAAAFDPTGKIKKLDTKINPVDAIEAIDKIDGFVTSLKQAGKVQEAKRLEQVITEFKAFNFAHREMINFHSKMMDSNFFSSKEGKGLVNKLVGKKYEISEDFLKLIEDNNDIVDNSLKLTGIKGYGSFKEQWQRIAENEEISDREKYRMEAIIRMNLAAWAMQNIAEDLTTTSEDITNPPIRPAGPKRKGDTILTKTSLEGQNLNNLDKINELIKSVTDEIDYVKNYHTKNQEEVNKLNEKLNKLIQKKQELEDSLSEEDIVQQNATFSAPEQTTTVNTESSDIVDSIIENKDPIDKLIEERLSKYGLPIFDIFDTITDSVERVIWRAKVGKPVDTISLTEAIDTLYNIYKDLSRLKNPENSQERLNKSLTLEYINAAQQEIEQELNYLMDYETSLRTGEAIPTFEYTSKTPATTTETSTEEGTTTRDSAESETAETIVDTKNGKRAKPYLTDLEKINKQIEAIKSQIEELTKDFRIMETEDFKRYTALLKKKEKGTIKPKEEKELESLREDIDQWTFITGIVVDGFRLSDLISQKAVLESAEIGVTNPVAVATSEDVLDAVEMADISGRANYSFLQAYDKVIISRKGDNLFIHHISKEEFEDLLGGIQPVYQVDESGKGNVVISIDEAKGIEASTGIRFATPTRGTDRVGALLQPTTSITGEEVYVQVKSLFGKEMNSRQGHNIQAIYESEPGQALELYVDLTNKYNKDFVDEYGAAYRLVTNKKKPTKAELQRLEDAKFELAKNISILALNDGDAVGTLKGIRDVNKDDKNDEILEAMRMALMDNEALLQSLIQDGADGLIQVKLEDSEGNVVAPAIKVQQVLPGAPSLNYIVDEKGDVVVESRPLIESQINKVVAIGYLENGKPFTNDGESANTVLLRKVQDRSKNMKVPFIVLNVGGQRIAYPVKVNTIDRNYEDEFRGLYEAKGLTQTEKANNLNRYLASKGIDIKVEGNAFIAFGNSNLNDTFFDEKLAQLKDINYFHPVENWIKPDVDMKEVLRTQVTVDIDVNNPLHSPKIKMDFSEVDVKRASTVAVTKAQNATKAATKKGKNINATNVTSVLFGKQCK